MRWNKPQDKEKRVRFDFLFLPKGDIEIRWLEFAKWEEVYLEEYDDDGEELYSEWFFECWLDT